MMAVKSTGSLSMSELHAEFGGGYSLSSYTRGGIYVPNGPASNANIPTTASSIAFSQFYGPVKAHIFNRTVSASLNDYELWTDAVAYGWNGVTPLQANIIIDGGVAIGSTVASGYAFVVRAGFPAGSILTVTVNAGGYIVGRGGKGGTINAFNGNNVEGSGRTSAKPGGNALYAGYPVSVTNYGTVDGGGGGGGLSNNYSAENGHSVSSPGGEGAGQNLPSNIGDYSQSWYAGIYHTGIPGTLTTGGYGYYQGGSGGNLGMSGSDSVNGPGNIGGAAGYYIVGNSNVTWISVGTRLGNAL